jgi:hypothetical protein
MMDEVVVGLVSLWGRRRDRKRPARLKPYTAKNVGEW